MAAIIDSLVHKISSLIRRAFGCKRYEFGNLAVGNIPEFKRIFIHTRNQAIRVWISLETGEVPVCGGGKCYITDVMICEDGFSFFMKNEFETCVISWFALAD